MHMSKKKIQLPNMQLANKCQNILNFPSIRERYPVQQRKIIIEKRVGSVDRKYAVSAIKHSLFLFPPSVLFAYELLVQDFTFKKICLPLYLGRQANKQRKFCLNK